MNNLYNQLNQKNPQLQNNGIQQLVQMIKNTNNPQQLLNNMAKQNPQLSQIIQTLNTSNITPKQMFMNLASQKGINPNEIIAMLK